MINYLRKTNKSIINYNREYRTKGKSVRILLILLVPLVFLAGCGTNVYHVSSPVMKWVWAKEHKVNAVLEPVKYRADNSITESGEKSKSVTMVTNFEKKLVKNLNISPSGERLIFEYASSWSKTYVPQIGSVDTKSGKDLTTLSDGDSSSFSPCYSSDGREIVLCSPVNGVPKLWSISSDGQKADFRQITTNKFIEVEPNVSKDGKKIVFGSIMPDTSEEIICVVNRDGTEPTYLRHGKSPVFSPDGKEIVFVAPDEDAETGKEKISNQVWTMGIRGDNIKQITHVAGNCQDPQYSPDGRMIAFASNDLVNEEGSKPEVANYNLWLIDSEGAQVAVALTNNPATDISPTWSPDGRFIYFCSNRGLNWNIWRLNLSENVMKLYPPADFALNIDSGSVILNWRYKDSATVGGFNVYFRTPEMKAATKLTYQPIKESTYSAKDLKTNMLYFFSVSSVGKDYSTESDRSLELMVRTPNVPAPMKVTATAEDGEIILNWMKVTDAAGYNIYFRPYFGKILWKVNNSSVKSNRFEMGGEYFKNAMTYNFCVAAVDKNGFEGEKSKFATGTLKIKKESSAKPATTNNSGDWGGNGSGSSDWSGGK